jgi:hypothetical protein
MSISLSLSTFFSLRRGVAWPVEATFAKLETAGLGSFAVRESFSLLGAVGAPPPCLRGKSEEDEPGDGFGFWKADADWLG